VRGGLGLDQWTLEGSSYNPDLLTPGSVAAGESWWNQQGTFTAPAQSSDAWANFATKMGTLGFNLLQIKAIQPGTLVSRDGAILRQNPGYAVGSPGITANLGMSTTTLMIGALGLVAVMFMFSGRGR
jgi:hypothetical protein